MHCRYKIIGVLLASIMKIQSVNMRALEQISFHHLFIVCDQESTDCRNFWPHLAEKSRRWSVLYWPDDHFHVKQLWLGCQIKPCEALVLCLSLPRLWWPWEVIRSSLVITHYHWLSLVIRPYMMLGSRWLAAFCWLKPFFPTNPSLMLTWTWIYRWTRTRKRTWTTSPDGRQWTALALASFPTPSTPPSTSNVLQMIAGHWWIACQR